MSGRIVDTDEALDTAKADLKRLILDGVDDPFKAILFAQIRMMQKDLDRRHITMTTEEFLVSLQNQHSLDDNEEE